MEFLSYLLLTPMVMIGLLLLAGIAAAILEPPWRAPRWTDLPPVLIAGFVGWRILSNNAELLADSPMAILPIAAMYAAAAWGVIRALMRIGE